MAVGGIIAVCTRNFVNFELGYGPVIGSFMGSFVVSCGISVDFSGQQICAA